MWCRLANFCRYLSSSKIYLMEWSATGDGFSISIPWECMSLKNVAANVPIELSTVKNVGEDVGICVRCQFKPNLHVQQVLMDLEHRGGTLGFPCLSRPYLGLYFMLNIPNNPELNGWSIDNSIQTVVRSYLEKTGERGCGSHSRLGGSGLVLLPKISCRKRSGVWNCWVGLTTA